MEAGFQDRAFQNDKHNMYVLIKIFLALQLLLVPLTKAWPMVKSRGQSGRQLYKGMFHKLNKLFIIVNSLDSNNSHSSHIDKTLYLF